jgi:hypothetical protein
LIVAVNEEENSRLEGLYERGLKNEVPDLKLVGPEEIRDIEPNSEVCISMMHLLSTYALFIYNVQSLIPLASRVSGQYTHLILALWTMEK